MQFFSRPQPISESPTWRRILYHPVGGLTEVGFSEDEALLLVVSHAGRGLFDLSNGERIARDDEMPMQGAPWINARERLVQGIDSVESQWFPVVGLWGGTLAQSCESGWSVLVKSTGRDESAILQRQGSREKWLVDTPITEIKAYGFSTSGRILVLATSSDVTSWREA